MRKYLLKFLLDFVDENWSAFEAFCEERNLDAESFREEIEGEI